MIQNEALREFFESIPATGCNGRVSADDLKKFLDGMDARKKDRLLTTRLSATVQQNIVTYIIADGSIKENHMDGEDERMSGLLNVVLNEIEKIANMNDRLAMLVLPNELGQTPFHKTMDLHGEPELFDALKKRLYNWGGDEYGDAYMQHFLGQSLGVLIDPVALQPVRGIRPSDTAEAQLLGRLCHESFEPMEYESLKTAFEKIRPLIAEFAEKYPVDPEDTALGHETRNARKTAIKKLSEDPDVVRQDKTPLMQAFPGALFDKLLDLHLKFNPKTLQQLADFVVEQLSKPDAGGDPSMHRRWQYSVMMSPPKSIDRVNDHLAPVIAGLDRRFGTDIAIDMTRKLLQLKHPHPEADGMLPLDDLDRDPQIRDYYLGGFLLNLRKELGSQEKFKAYVEKAVAPILPEDFNINLRDYEPKTKVRSYDAIFRP